MPQYIKMLILNRLPAIFCDSLIQVFTWWHSSSLPICIHLSIKKSPQGPNKENNPILSIKNVYKTF